MLPASVAGDPSLGHIFSPSPITPSVTDVLITEKIPHVAGDVIAPHALGQSVHGGTILSTSTTVYINKKGAARLMDTGDCGAMILGSAGTVLIGG